MSEAPLLVEKNNRLGLLTLNRPKALNSLTGEMIGILAGALADWQKDPQIYGVIIKGAGERAFCAGADVRAVHEAGRKNPELACRFFADEYAYNWQLSRFSKPHIALMQGLVLGGGAGVSIHGTHKVAAENFSFGMPETTIGLFPDVGASWFLGHLPNSVGLYLALTGRSINRADALHLGLLTHCIEARHFGDIEQAISQGEPVDALLDDLHMDPGEGELNHLHGWIEAMFSASSLQEIFERATSLEKLTKGWSVQVLEELQQKSPTSLHLALALWKKGRRTNLRRILQLEYSVACNLMYGHDFYEGVRAQLIDKDKTPDWSPFDISDLSKSDLARLLSNHHGQLELADSENV